MKLRHLFCLWLFCWASTVACFSAETAGDVPGVGTLKPVFNVRLYVIEGNTPLSGAALDILLSKYVGTNVPLEKIVRAAAETQQAYREQGHPAMSVSIMQKQITNGIVTLHVFPAVLPQIFVSGERYLVSSNGVSIALGPLTPESPFPSHLPAKAGATNAATTATATNTGPKFVVKSYLVMGNSLLSPQTIKSAVLHHMGTNVVVGDILAAGLDLQKEYRDRGYPTVNVTIPQQRIGTNGQVKIRVFEGRLWAILVKGNHYFSSNNVMRALPGLQTNEILNGLVFQAELDRANANQDRQIYPQIEPGPEENTTVLRLDVKDRLPLHAKMELNNESSPGTPDLRVNASAVYNNLWQLEHSLGIQYGFSPEAYKAGEQWNFYDQPLVANYSLFYQMPLGGPEAIDEVIANHPGDFGYSEATRQFRMPPASGQPNLTFYASRATIDTGVTTLSAVNIVNNPGVISVNQQDTHEDLTVNDDLGTRLAIPLTGSAELHSDFSGGFDFKNYDETSYGTNIYSFTQYNRQPNGTLLAQTSVNPTALPGTATPLNYIPLTLGGNTTWRTARTTLVFGLSTSVNTWYSGSHSNLEAATSSTQSSGHWVTLDPSLSADIVVHTNWILSLRANGQWASEPLISNEQFGAGGVNSVRGYREGEVFGDTGWRVSAEQQTPSHVVGFVRGDVPLVIRGSVYMDYARVYLLDPQTRTASTGLWGVGVGAAASLGSHWEARFLFSEPLLGTTTTSAYSPFFNFNLTAQF